MAENHGDPANLVKTNTYTILKAIESTASKFRITKMIPGARLARLAREIKNFETTPPWGITCRPEKEDCYDVLLVSLMGPIGSPYENGLFKLTVNIPEKYPFEPPLVKFVTPVYHPNIDKGGRICMDMLKMPPKGAWLPTITLDTLLVSLQILLANPNPDDPLMMDVANEYKYDIQRFMENARRHTDKHACGCQKGKRQLTPEPPSTQDSPSPERT